MKFNSIDVNLATNIPYRCVFNPSASAQSNISINLCPDQNVGIISYAKTNEWSLDKSIITARNSTNNYSNCWIDYSKIAPDNYFILILESPHVDEYDSNKQPIGPACGRAGYNLEKHLDKCINNSPCLLKRLNQKIDYKLVLINSVQYQTSCGLSLNNSSNKKQRDTNWLTEWNYGFNADLVQRLNAFKSKGHQRIVVNLCTLGLSGLHFYVNKALVKNRIRFHEGYHPAVNWNHSSKRHFI